MAPHHEHPHLPQPYEEPPERPNSEETMERLEMDRAAGPTAIPFTWSGMKELAYVVSVVLGLAGAYWGIRGEIQDGHRDVQELAACVLIIERGRAENIPRLEEMIRLNGIQDQRIQNLTEALGSLRTTVVDLARVVASQADLIHEAHERQAVLEERIGRSLPHDR